MPVDGIGGGRQVARGHQVRERVVVDERGVLVRPGHAVDPEATRGVVVPERGPQSRGFDEQLDARPCSNSSSPVAATYRRTASAMSALMWNAAVPAGQ